MFSNLRFWQRVAAGVALVAASGCTIFDPMSLSDRDRRFALKAGDVSSAPEAGAPCRRGAVDDPCEPRPAELDRYVGTLAQVMWEVDIERRALTRDALERARLNSAFNALTWPVVAFAAAKKLRDPGWSPRDAVALGFAAHRMLGEGIPERDRIYLQTANRLACSLMAAEALLYEKKPPTTGVSRGFELEDRNNMLRDALETHELKRASIVSTLAIIQPPTQPSAQHQVERQRLEAVGKAVGDGRGGADPAGPFIEAINGSFNHALTTY